MTTMTHFDSVQILGPLLRVTSEVLSQFIHLPQAASVKDDASSTFIAMGAAFKKIAPRPELHVVRFPMQPAGPPIQPTGPGAPHPAAIALLLLVGAAELYQSRNTADETTDDLDQELHELAQREGELRRQMTGDVWFWDPNALVRRGHELLEVKQLIRQAQLEQERIQLEQKKRSCTPNSNDYFKINQRLVELENEIAAIPTQTLGTVKLWDILVSQAPAVDAPKSVDTPENKEDADAKQLARALDERLKGIRSEILERLNEGGTAPEMYRWFNETLRLELVKMHEQIVAQSKDQNTRDIFHDVKTRLTAFSSSMHVNLEQGRLQDVRRACEPNGNSLSGMIGQLQVDFSTSTKIRYDGPRHIAVSPTVDRGDVVQMLQNLVSNGGDHPRKVGDITPITFSLHVSRDDETWLVYSDQGEGATAEAVEKINQGVRIHNGAVVDDDDPEAREHGFGWPRIREAWRQLGIVGESDSEPGNGFTTVMVLPRGLLEPDVASYMASGSEDFDELKILIDQMPPERRLIVVHDMIAYTSHAIEDLLHKLMEDPKGEHPNLKQRAALLLRRFGKLDVLYKDIAITPSNVLLFRDALVAEKYAELLKTLMENIE